MVFVSRVILCAIVVCASANILPAELIGYWRFEDTPGILADSSGNGRTLTGTSSPVSYTLPGSGVGSTFPTTIPQTSASNAKATQFNGSNYFTSPDDAAYTSSTLSVEAFINGSDFATSTSNKSIAGQWNGTPNQRGWLLAAGNTTSSFLSFLYSTTGSNTVNVTSTLSLLPNVDYYVGVTINMADLTSSGITFYVKDLTNNGPLLVNGQAHGSSSYFDAAAAFSIGSTSQPSSQFNGVIDEVRLSNTKLAQGELLISAIPEPGTYALAFAGLAGYALWKRRR